MKTLFDILRTFFRHIFHAAMAALLAWLLLLGIILGNGRSQITGNPQVMIVLGAGTGENGPTPVLQHRINAACSYWTEHPDTLVILSGGQGAGESETEAVSMRNSLASCGVPDESMRLEENSTNTWQNLCYSKAIMLAEGYGAETPVLIVSSNFHMFRVRMLARRAGLNASTLSAPTTGKGTRIFYYFREVFAVIKSAFMDR